MGRWSDLLRDRDIVVISPQFWGEMWVSKHWIASELSKHNRVLFVEPPVWVGGLVRRPSTIPLGLPRIIRRFRRIGGQLHAFTPLLWPRLVAPSPEASILGQVRRQVERLGLRDCIVLNFTTKPYYIHNINDEVAVYYCVDPAFLREGEDDHEIRMCRESDLVYAVSDAYRRRLEANDPSKPIHVIPHGIDFEAAQRVREDPALGPPPELERLGRPLLGFVGSIHDTNIDVSLLEYLSRERPDYQVALIGPYRNNPIGTDLSRSNLERIRRLGNVHLLGPRPFHQLARYVKFFDVGLVLIELERYDGRFQTRRRTLFKLLHYFSQGKPIVIPDLYEVGSVGHLLYVAHSWEEYVAHLDASLRENPELAGRRMAYASQFSFEKMLEKIVAPIAELEQRARAGQAGSPGEPVRTDRLGEHAAAPRP
jgi:hypothetical protein